MSLLGAWPQGKCTGLQEASRRATALSLGPKDKHTFLGGKDLDHYIVIGFSG